MYIFHNSTSLGLELQFVSNGPKKATKVQKKPTNLISAKCSFSSQQLKTSTLNLVLGGTIKYTNKQVEAQTQTQRISLSLVWQCESRTSVDSVQGFFFVSSERIGSYKKSLTFNLMKTLYCLKRKRDKGNPNKTLITHLGLCTWKVAKSGVQDTFTGFKIKGKSTN